MIFVGSGNFAGAFVFLGYVLIVAIVSLLALCALYFLRRWLNKRFFWIMASLFTALFFLSSSYIIARRLETSGRFEEVSRSSKISLTMGAARTEEVLSQPEEVLLERTRGFWGPLSEPIRKVETVSDKKSGYWKGEVELELEVANKRLKYENLRSVWIFSKDCISEVQLDTGIFASSSEAQTLEVSYLRLCKQLSALDCKSLVNCEEEWRTISQRISNEPESDHFRYAKFKCEQESPRAELQYRYKPRALRGYAAMNIEFHASCKGDEDK